MVAPHTARGFSLVETLVAALVLIISLAGIAPLFGLSTRATRQGRAITLDTLLAIDKLEELRHSSQEPGGSLDASMPGYSDVFDAAGRRLDPGYTSKPSRVRRWSVHPFSQRPERMELLQVRVISDVGETRVLGLRRREGA